MIFCLCKPWKWTVYGELPIKNRCWCQRKNWYVIRIKKHITICSYWNAEKMFQFNQFHKKGHFQKHWLGQVLLPLDKHGPCNHRSFLGFINTNWSMIMLIQNLMWVSDNKKHFLFIINTVFNEYSCRSSGSKSWGW